MKTTTSIFLKIILFLAGLFIIFTGLNVALGGMLTLGWQDSTKFFEVTSMQPYLVQDSHIRFMGGIWTGIGLLFLVSVSNLQRYQSLLNFSFGLIFLAGLARFSQMNFGILFGPKIVGSLAAELIGMPILYFWLAKSTQSVNESANSVNESAN